MKVVLLTRAMASTNALVRRLLERDLLHLVVCEDFGGGRAAPRVFELRNLRDLRVWASPAQERVLDAWSGMRGMADRERNAIERVYGAHAAPLVTEPPMVRVGHKRWDGLARILDDLRPEVILSYGTSLLPETVFGRAGLHALNIHAGLAPHYRGMYCVEQALLARDLDRVGVTIHVIEGRIDGGAILAQGTPRIERDDDEHVLVHRTLELGHRLAIETLCSLREGRSLAPTAQVRGVGRLYLARDFGRDERRRLRRMIKGGLVRDFVAGA